MARLFTTGAEAKDAPLSGAQIDGQGFGSASAPSFEASIVRSGLYSFKYDSGASNLNVYNAFLAIGGVAGRAYFLRAYVRIPAYPSTSTPILHFDSKAAVKLTTTGSLQLWNMSGTPAQIGSGSAAISLDTWYRVELKLLVNTGSADDTAELQLDGLSVASTTTGTIATLAPVNAYWGWVNASPGANAIMYMDDVALNDDQGASQNTYPGDGKVVLLLPISDNARAAKWTGGVGGTTNLWQAVGNTPPVGKPSASATDTTQIEHAGSAAGTTDAYDANMTTYATAGIASGDTINTVEFIEADGEDIATGTKLLNFEVLSNPVIASPGNVTAGSDVGACGTYPTNWTVRRSPPVYNPSVTVGTSPVMRARRPETASRVASVCFMGMYVDYTPAAVVTAVPYTRTPLLGPILAQ
jgi:hypothetical protein